MEHTGQESDHGSTHKRKNKEEAGNLPWKDLKVMTEYDDRLREAERYKANLKENKQLVNDARKNKKLLTKVVQLKDQAMERLTRWNGENVRLKKLFEVTNRQLEAATLEASKVNEELDGALVKVSELKGCILNEREAAVQEFLGSQAFHRAIRPHCTRKVHFEKRKWMAEIDEYRQKGETFALAVDPSNEEESDDEASVDE
ncbi:GRIP domain-containing protein RUD3-like [Pyrus ussuriensis x Pyrus communis]|uniref:GRIP domain-containing protein RUD3-like n=1 Tax=Pyrus ussuriensis x Pyrus communis TaxID=2448454 RepID=A0A5N5FTR0_9ROSA|nr:GRIP domain-containing protein RUD3-like [Pyrus ussuriensis x Pyrus communis]